MNWFPVDKHVRNDWRVKAVRRRFGSAGVGRLLALWSYVASEGSQTDEGRGIQRDGTPLDLHGMAEDCDFVDDNGRPDLDALRAFLTFLGEIGHIDPSDWHERGIVFLPAMNRRLEAYRISKGRGTDPGQPKRRPGRPRKPENSPDRFGADAGGFPGVPPGVSENPSGGSTDSGPKVPDLKTPGNSGKRRGTPGNSGPTNISLDGISGSDPLEETDDPKIPSPAALVELWNRVREPGPKVLELTPNRRQNYRRALKLKPDLGDWEKAIRYLNGAAWANAPGGNGTHANFRADLDYLAKPGNVTKALERLAAKDLPGAKSGPATGRVAPTAGKFADAVKKRDGGDGGHD